MNLSSDPGSSEARSGGCICDLDQQSPFRVEKQCPVHGLAELRAEMPDTGDWVEVYWGSIVVRASTLEGALEMIERMMARHAE